MDTNKPIAGLSVLVAGALVAGAAVASGGGVWYLQHRATVAAELRVTQAEADTRRVERRARELESQLASTTAALRERAKQEPSPDEIRPSPAENAPAAEDGKNIGYVKGVESEGATRSLKADYAELLTGNAAVRAHKADGLGDIDGEQYYIRNVNPALRTIPISEDAKVIVWSWFAETEDIQAKTIPVSEFLASMPGGSDADESRSGLPYWFTVKNGEIVRIEEQFVP